MMSLLVGAAVLHPDLLIDIAERVADVGENALHPYRRPLALILAIASIAFTQSGGGSGTSPVFL